MRFDLGQTLLEASQRRLDPVVGEVPSRIGAQPSVMHTAEQGEQIQLAVLVDRAEYLEQLFCGDWLR